MNDAIKTFRVTWPAGLAFDLPVAVRESLTWALQELPLRQVETGREQLLVLDAATGEMLFLTEGDADSTEIPAEEASRFGRGRETPGSLILVHTHPRDTPFSELDFATFLNHIQWAVSVVCSPESGSIYWLGRTEYRELADYRWDGEHFACFGEAARDIAAIRSAGCETSLVDGSVQCRMGPGDSVRDFSDAVTETVVRRANHYHSAGLDYEAVRDPHWQPPATPGRMLTYDVVSTREAYTALGENAVMNLARLLLAAALIVVLLARGSLFTSLGLSTPAFMTASVLAMPLLPLSLLSRLRRFCGETLLRSSPRWGWPRQAFRVRRRATLIGH